MAVKRCLKKIVVLCLNFGVNFRTECLKLISDVLAKDGLKLVGLFKRLEHVKIAVRAAAFARRILI